MRFIRSLLRLAGGVALAHAAVIAAFAAFQLKLLYLPRRYGQDSVEAEAVFAGSYAMERIEVADNSNGDGRQTSFFCPALDSPMSASRRGQQQQQQHQRQHQQQQDVQKERLFVVMGGNAALAMEWMYWLRHYLKHQRKEFLGQRPASFLLVDYPGYGFNDGSPSPAGLLANAYAAVGGLATHLGFESTADLTRHYRIGLLGHSLGCAGVMQFGADVMTKASSGEQQDDKALALAAAIDRVLLLAPFSSVTDFGRRIMFDVPPHSLVRPLIRHEYNNLAFATAFVDARRRLVDGDVPRLAERVRFDVLHGTNDQQVPFYMGEKLAAHARSLDTSSAGVRFKFEAVERCQHNNILDFARDKIYARLMI